MSVELTAKEKVAKIKADYLAEKNKKENPFYSPVVKVCATPEDDTCESCQG